MSETSESSNGNDGVLVHVIDAEVIHAIPTFASKPIDEEKNLKELLWLRTLFHAEGDSLSSCIFSQVYIICLSCYILDMNSIINTIFVDDRW